MRCTRRIQSVGWAPTIAVCALLMLAAAPSAAADPPGAPGSFLGAVLITDNAPAASSFYSTLFGWDIEAAEDGGFAVRHKGRMIAGISPLQDSSEEFDESSWLVGIAVEDVDRALGAAETNTATIHEPVERVSDYGRFAVIADRQKAPVLLIEPGRMPIGGTTGHGSWVWAELWTNDLEDAIAFYANVVGVDHETTDREGKPYNLFASQGEPRSGIVIIPPELGNVEPGWAPYVGVDNLVETLAQVRTLGGRVIFATAEDPVRGAVALIGDPPGAVLFVYQIGSATEESE